ncbi:MAG: hypothetical protein U0792_07595 [Gemmataceae bacterium]
MARRPARRLPRRRCSRCRAGRTPKRWPATNIQHAAYLLAAAVIPCWIMSPWSDKGQPIVEDWFKILIFYFLLVTTIHDEEGLRQHRARAPSR